jgi:hypothetical protein
MLKILTKRDKELLQRRGYIYEHLLCLYSVVSDTTALYEDAFPVFVNSSGEADVVLFSLGPKKKNRLKCIQELTQLRINKLNVISPEAFAGLPGLRTRYIDWDFHIDLDEFDLDLKGSKYRSIRHALRKVDVLNYRTKLDREFTHKHTYILSRHLMRHKLEAWDYEELLSLDRFFREHDHCLMMEAYKDDSLVGFDVVDFFEDNRIMVVPLGIYLQDPFVSDFMMYENIKFAKDEGYEWLSVGPTCGLAGLRRFKEKWLAKPKFKLYVQEIYVKPTARKRGYLQGDLLE